MKIIFDMFGSDSGPQPLLEGIINAIKKEPEIQPLLSGDKDILLPLLSNCGRISDKIEILDAKEVITNEDAAANAIKQKKNSSLIVAIDALKNRDDVFGMVSAGSTGAVLSAGVLKLGRLNGVLRPALAPVFPTLNGKEVCLVDCGANVDCKPEYLEQFAHMGAAYMQSLYGIENPRVALVSVGVEDKKGNELTKQVFVRLKQSSLNFVGNMEARDALSGDFDVLVCDGFVGNVLLKTTEGTAGMVMKILKKSIMGSFSAKVGALFMKKAFKKLKLEMDYHAKGGAPLLGVKKVLIKGHGSSNATAAEAAMLQAYKMAKAGLIQKIESAISAGATGI